MKLDEPLQNRKLPAIRRDMTASKRAHLFTLKMHLCTRKRDKPGEKSTFGSEVQRQTLVELIQYTSSQAGQKIFTESMMPHIIEMLRSNLFRELPLQTEDYDPDEDDEPVDDSSWPYLQAVYEFMLRFIVSPEVKSKVLKKHLSKKFCSNIIDLFNSEDPRERDYLKTILHRIYGKFMSYRSFIRQQIAYTFYRFIYETQQHNGIGELLEILGSIINGFAIPLKSEHVHFLSRALIPLHKPNTCRLYHLQLSYCMAQYVEKDSTTARIILLGLFKYWPWSWSQKQVLLFNELEDIMELLNDEVVAEIYKPLFMHLARCLSSSHFQVQERCLYLWQNEQLITAGCLSEAHMMKSLPYVYAPLSKLSKDHWNSTVQNQAMSVTQRYMQYDLERYHKVEADHQNNKPILEEKEKARAQQWEKLREECAPYDINYHTIKNG